MSDNCRSKADGASETVAVSRRTATLRVGMGGLVAALLGSGAVRVSAREATPAADREAEQGAYIVIRQYKLTGGHTEEEFVGLVESGYVPIIRAVPGFLEYYHVQTTEGPVGIAIFSDEAGATESTERALDWVEQNLAGFFEGPPKVITGIIRIHEESRAC